jgi:2,3-diketo-5-methylthiopentyl-1-phosphate enolase
MSEAILFPSARDLKALSERVGGLVHGVYSFPSADSQSARRMSVQIASGQTLGFVPENLEFFENFVGRVVSVDQAEGQARAEIAYPASLFGVDIAGILTILFGKVSFSPGLRLESVQGDVHFLNRLKGPKFGLDGIRAAVGKLHLRRPLLMAILKPGLGPSDDPLADQFGRLVAAGTDLVKDDETRIDIGLDDTLRRLDRVLKAGQGRGMYVTHLTGPAFELRERALRLQKAGAQAFLFCPYTYGLSVLQSLCADSEIRLPIFAHPAFTGVMGSGPSAILPQVSLGTLLRWAGCDAVLYPSPYGSIALSRVDAQGVHEALVRPEGSLKKSASVPSAGIMPDYVSKIKEDFGCDVVVNAGTGMARSGAGVEDGARLFTNEIVKHFGV